MPMIFNGASYDDTKADKLNEALGWLDNMLEGRVFVAGENLSIADISIIVTITNLDVSKRFFSGIYSLVARMK